MLMPVQAGDGTTSVVVMAGALLDAADKLLQKGIHPTTVSESFQKAAAKSVEILTEMAIPLELTDRDALLKAANTSLNSKVVSQNSAELSPIAVYAVLKVVDPARENNVNLKDIKIIKKLGGTVDDTELVDGMVFEQKAANINGRRRPSGWPPSATWWWAGCCPQATPGPRCSSWPAAACPASLSSSSTETASLP